MKSWVALCLASALILMCVGGVILGVTVSGWKRSVYDTWTIATKATMDTVTQNLNQHVQFIEFAALSVPHIIASMDTTPLSRLLAQMFDAYDGESGFSFGSFGYMQFNGTAKFSWQVAAGFGCPDYMYAFSDESTWPTFLGYCVNRSGYYLDGIPDYVGTDWGLKPQEVSLFQHTIQQTFLPITFLLGSPIFTFESYDASLPGVVFAEMNLTTFSANIASSALPMTQLHICETQTGLMIASTDPNAVLYPNGTRKQLPTFNDTLIDWSQRVTYVGDSIDWTIHVTAEWTKVYGDLIYTTTVAGVVGMCIVIAGILAIFILGYCCVSRVLHKEDAYALFSDIPAGAATQKGEMGVPL